MQKELNRKLKAKARELGTEFGKQAELDFGAGAEWMHEQLTIPVVVECKHDFEPYYNWCSELTGYRCEKCGEEKD